MMSTPFAIPGFPGAQPASSGVICPTPKDTVLRDGTAQLYRFRGDATGPTVLLVPSLINRWYVLDLRRGASVAEALVAAGFDTWCLDWGEPNDEDRYLEWDDVLARLARMVRHVRRATGTKKLGVLGYCIGGTLTSIHTALEPDSVQALVNLAGPIDFEHAGFLGHMTMKIIVSWCGPGHGRALRPPLAALAEAIPAHVGTKPSRRRRREDQGRGPSLALAEVAAGDVDEARPARSTSASSTCRARPTSARSSNGRRARWAASTASSTTRASCATACS
jgi:pimeloyl-ACP methyl ester carboxylesterase